MTITGIHHITAIAANPQQNLDFYAEALGLRLVKLTVNFDDPGIAAPAGSLDYWQARLRSASVPVEDAGTRFGERVLRFADPDGLPLEIVATTRAR
jgi:glyoxalase family protein